MAAGGRTDSAEMRREVARQDEEGGNEVRGRYYGQGRQRRHSIEAVVTVNESDFEKVG